MTFKYWPNDVHFVRSADYKYGIVAPSFLSGKFTIRDFKISSGQDPDGEIKIDKVFTCESRQPFSFRIGRHGSKEVADWFMNATSDGQGNGGNTFHKERPDKLNFALKGDLEFVMGPFNNIEKGSSNNITASFPDVVLAQGHTGASNNWWMGSPTLQCGATLDVGHAGWLQGRVLRTNGKFDWVQLLCQRGGSNPVDTVTLMAMHIQPGF